MNWMVIKKAVDNGIDSLTDSEYEEYTKVKNSLSPEEWSPIKKAVDNGIDALTDEEYALYSASKSKISSDEIPKPPIPDVVAPDVLETMKQQAENEGDLYGQTALNLFPRTARNIAEDGSVTGLLTSVPLDILSSGGRGINALVGRGRGEPYGMMKTSPSFNLEDTTPWYHPTNLVEIAKGVGEGMLTSPATPLGGSVFGAASKIPMIARLGTIGKNAAAGAVSGGALAGGENVAEQIADPSQQGINLKEAGLATAIGTGLGGLGGAIGGKLAKADESMTGRMAEDMYNLTKSTNLSPKEAFKIPEYARGVVKELSEPEVADFGKYQKLATDYSARKSGALRPMEEAANRFWPELQQKFNAYRQNAGEEMGRIEQEGLQGGVDITPIRKTLEDAMGEHGLSIVQKLDKDGNPTGKYTIEMGEEATLNPSDHPELQKVVDVFYNDKQPTTGKGLRASQQRAINSAKATTQMGKANQADRILGILDDEIDNTLAQQLDEIRPDLSKEYARAKQKYAQSKEILNYMGQRLGKPLKWTDDMGIEHDGIQTGPSFFQALTNTGAQQRGATLLANLAESEFGMPNLQRQAILARYAEESAGIRGPRKTEEPKGAVKKIFGGIFEKLNPKGAIKKMLPEQAKISEKLAQPRKAPSTESTKAEVKKGLVGAVGQRPLSEEDKKKLKFTESVRKGLLGIK